MRFNSRALPWLLVLSLGCFGAEQKSASQSKRGVTSKSTSVADSNGKRTRFVPVDFQAIANVPLTPGGRHDLSALPNGDQQFNGTDFHIGPKILQVIGRSFPRHPR